MTSIKKAFAHTTIVFFGMIIFLLIYGAVTGDMKSGFGFLGTFGTLQFFIGLFLGYSAGWDDRKG